MKLIIAGSRDIHFTSEFIDSLYGNVFIIDDEDNMLSEIVSGGCSGVDKAAEWWARDTQTPLKIFTAEWDKYGKSAGPIRNRQMANYGDALLLIWDGKSRGSANMKLEMEKLNKPIYEVILRDSER